MSPVTDLATTSLEITIGSIEKRLVAVYGEGPREFDAITMAVDVLANEINWTRSG